MPFRPDAIVVQSDLEDAYSSWEALARQCKQPAQAIWKSLETALDRIRFDGQWGETIRQESIPTYFRERYGVSNLYCVDLAAFHRCFIREPHRHLARHRRPSGLRPVVPGKAVAIGQKLKGGLPQGYSSEAPGRCKSARRDR